MKKHNISKVVLVTILVFLLLSWILPAAYYSGEYVEQGRVQMGLFDLFNYPLTALSYFGYIAFYIILVGGFYGVLYKIPAYRSFLDKIVEMMKGKEKVLLSIMIVVISLLVSICGLQIGVALFIPFVVSLILLMGYDKIVAALVTVGSISAGLIGSTYAYTNLSVLLQTLNLNYDYQIGVRFIILLVGIVLVIFNTLMYIKKNISELRIEKKTVKKAEKVVEEEDEVIEEEDELDDSDVEIEEPVHKSSKKTSSKSTTKSNASKNSKSSKSSSKKSNKSSKTRKNPNKAALKDEDIIVVRENMRDDELLPLGDNGKHKVWPFVTFFCLLFVLMVLAFVTWGENGFGVKLFDDITKSAQDFKLFGFPLIAKVLGTFNSFGSWTLMDMLLPMALTLLLLVIIYKVSLDDVFEGFMNGAKKALAPAGIVILIYTILVLVTYHPFQLVIYKTILGSSKGFNIAKTSGIAILASLFNSDIAYSFQSVVPYFTSIVTKSGNYPLAAIIFQSMYGLTMLVAPTSLGLMVTLSFLNVSYKEWFKNVWKLLLELFVLLLIVFIILALV